MADWDIAYGKEKKDAGCKLAATLVRGSGNVCGSTERIGTPKVGAQQVSASFKSDTKMHK